MFIIDECAYHYYNIEAIRLVLFATHRSSHLFSCEMWLNKTLVKSFYGNARRYHSFEAIGLLFWYTQWPPLPQYSVPRSVNIRSMRSLCCTKKVNTFSFSISADAIGVFVVYIFTVSIHKSFLIYTPSVVKGAYVKCILGAPVTRMSRFNFATGFVFAPAANSLNS